MRNLSRMNLVTDRSLIGTEWIKTEHKHSGQRARIESVSERGPKLRFIGVPVQNRHTHPQQMFMRIDWSELGTDRPWQPADRKSQERYDKWVMQTSVQSVLAHPDDPNADLVRNAISQIVRDPLVIVHTDKEGFVLDAKREPEEEQRLPCSGGWHKGALLPISQFSKIDRGPRNGEYKRLCNKCSERSRASFAKNYAAKRKASENAIALDILIPPKEKPTMPESKPATPVTNGLVTHQWRIEITVVKVVVVEATDFLDAATKAGEGEVTKVERIG